MKSTSGGQRMDVEQEPITETTADRLVKEKLAYAKAKEQFISSFDYDDDSTYWLLSTKFISEWKRYTGYDQSNLSYRPRAGTLPNPYNKNLLVSEDPKHIKLRPGLMEGQDYEIVSQKIMETFKAYKGELIEKPAHKLSNGKKIVQIYGVEFQYFFLSQRVVGDIDTGSKMPEFQIMKAEISRYVTLKELRKACMKNYDRFYNRDSAKDVKIWKMNKDMNPKKYHEIVKKAAHPQMKDSYKLKLAYGNLVDKDDSLVEDMALTEDDYLIIEIQEMGKQWVIKEGSNEESCEFCRKYLVLNVECGCKRVKYCSQQCKSRDSQYHKKKCALADEEELKEDISFAMNKNSRQGICGLSNLGNTCFMNSCLQCLSNSIHLTEYFVNKSYVNEINKTNPIGTKGKLTVKYAKMIQALWCFADDTYSPYNLKNGISDFQPMFSGYSQHDSQELLSFLLDGLHEDLNRVINKPYVESIDYNGEPEEVYAFESWKRYLMRNRSIIVDLFMGQYKSKVVCPDCKFQSITFDPFSTISLPIPQVSKITIDTFVFFSNYRQTPKKIVIDAAVKSIKAWKEQISKILSIDPTHTNFYILTFDGESEEYTNDSNPDKLLSAQQGYSKSDIFLVEYSKQEVADMKNSVLIYTKFCKNFDVYGKIEKQSTTFKRPFYWKSHKLMGHQVYFRIFTFLYRIALMNLYKSSSSASASTDHETISKNFDKAYSDFAKGPFQIYLMLEPKKTTRSDLVYEKQVLLQFNTPVHDLLFDANGQLRKVEFQVRFKKELKDDIKKLNTYEDYDKGRKNAKNEDDNTQYSIEDCLREFEKTEKLEVGNEWRCPKCKDFKQAYKSMSLYKTPKILIIHLKRFKQKSTYLKSKIGSLIKFPLQLNLDGYVINKTLPEAYFKEQGNNVNTRESSRYQLYAVSNHYGSLGGGHYTAYAKNNGEWYDFNDSHVHKVKVADVISSAAYMLFYRRLD